MARKTKAKSGFDFGGTVSSVQPSNLKNSNTVKKFILILSVGLALAGWSMAESRTWTQASTGKTLNGEIAEVRGDKVRIKMDGNRVMDLPIAMLSDGDKTFIKDWQAAKTAGAASGTAAESGKMALPKEGPVEVEVEDIHLCCKGCRDAVSNSLGSLTGVTLEVKDTVIIKAGDADLARAAFGAIVERGFFGESKYDLGHRDPKASTAKVANLKINGYHNCCGKCQSAIEDALNSVDGVKTIDVQKGAATIDGDFLPSDVFAALRKAGVSARVAPER